MHHNRTGLCTLLSTTTSCMNEPWHGPTCDHYRQGKNNRQYEASQGLADRRIVHVQKSHRCAVSSSDTMPLSQRWLAN